MEFPKRALRGFVAHLLAVSQYKYLNFYVSGNWVVVTNIWSNIAWVFEKSTHTNQWTRFFSFYSTVSRCFWEIYICVATIINGKINLIVRNFRNCMTRYRNYNFPFNIIFNIQFSTFLSVLQPWLEYSPWPQEDPSLLRSRQTLY